VCSPLFNAQYSALSTRHSALRARSAEGAKCKSLGQRPRRMQIVVTALKARDFRRRTIFCCHPRSSPSPFVMPRLQRFVSEVTRPGALPQAVAFRALGALLSPPIKPEHYSLSGPLDTLRRPHLYSNIAIATVKPSK
jgi:hypothetical protein